MNGVVLAISGSLRGKSFTEKMLDLCLEGMGSDLEVHKFYPHRMKIGPCTGCWSCWGKKRPGVCVQQDDFSRILEVYLKADYVLMAAPLYVFGFPATVKNVIDRFFITLQPAQVKSSQGFSVHPKRWPRHPKAVLISSCGFPEIENFDLLRNHFRLICQQMDWQQAGDLLIPASGCAHAPKLFNRKYQLLKEAGAELRDDRISAKTAAQVAAPVMDEEDYRRMSTANFQKGILAKLKRSMLAVKAVRRLEK